MFKFFTNKNWFPWSIGGSILILVSTWYQVQLDVKINEWFGEFYDTLQKALTTPNSVSEKEFIAEAVKKTFVGIININKIERKASLLNKLVIGLECGGSDGFSGISANPTLGVVSDIIVTLGGRTILSEFPELNGVEKELIKRCDNLKNAKKFVSIMQSYKNWAEKFESGFFDNPSPGNIKDGLITDAIKSAGAAKKGGISPIVDILDYGEQIKKNGLSLLCTPGNDVESTTGLAGSGANIILFTTGLGTPTGNPIAPVIKISSNSNLYYLHLKRSLIWKAFLF